MLCLIIIIGLKFTLYCHHAPHSFTDLEVKVPDIELFCLMKCIYHISQSSENIHISNRVCFHSITTARRVNAMEIMPWGWLEVKKLEELHTLVSLSSFFFVKCILILLARHDSGELRCPATALTF